MKVSPSSFNARKNHERLEAFGIQAGLNRYNEAEKLLTRLKEVNRKDPNFCWTCTCDEHNAAWMFAYSKHEVFTEANGIAVENVDERSFEDKLLEALFGHRLPESPSCSCPFSR